MTTFTLYSKENPNGLVLAKVADKSLEHVMKSYCKQTYGSGKFQVVMKQPRKPEEIIVRYA